MLNQVLKTKNCKVPIRIGIGKNIAIFHLGLCANMAAFERLEKLGEGSFGSAILARVDGLFPLLACPSSCASFLPLMWFVATPLPHVPKIMREPPASPPLPAGVPTPCASLAPSVVTTLPPCVRALLTVNAGEVDIGIGRCGGIGSIGREVLTEV